MKRIRTLPGPTLGLANYLDQCGDPTHWRRFCNDAPESYRELRRALVARQHGPCGYCEIDLIENDIQIEHVIPSSDPAQGPRHALDYANLMAACRGGGAREFDADGLNDSARFGGNSCGQAKGDINVSGFIDPRNMPALPSLLQVRPDGIIIADANACASNGVAIVNVQKTIDILQLNIERLRLARENRWNDLKKQWDFYRGEPDVMRAAARQELLLSDDNNLTKFFTTARSYFGSLAELILVEPPQAWI